MASAGGHVTMRADAVERLLRKGTTPLGGIRPRYDGLGLPNVMSSALAAFGITPPSLGIPDRVLDPDLLRAKTVVVLAVDGLGYTQLLAAKRKLKGLAILDAAREDGAFFPITATSPSTTVSAIGSLCTARSPQDHGLIGYRLWLREFGGVANMIRFAPIDGSGSPFNPAGFVTVPTAFEIASRARVRSYVLTRDRYAGSALSQMFHQGALVGGYTAISDFAVRLREAIRFRGRKLVFAYWDVIDAIGHRFGTLGAEFLSELATFDSTLEREVLRREKDAVLLITADHGHINTSAKRRVDLRARPALLSRLAVPPTGEPRFTYLHAVDGDGTRLREQVQDELGEIARVCTADQAFRASMFGIGPPPPKSRERVGDVLLAPKRDGTLVYGYPGERVNLIGRHGGFSAEEMLVPLLVVRT